MTELEVEPSLELRAAYFGAVAEMEVLTYSLRDELKKNTDLPGGVRLHLDRACSLLTQVRRFEDSEAQSLKRVGIFGVPKQGKSSILNALLGMDILPTARPPATNTLVDLVDAPDDANANGALPWKLTRLDDTGFETSEQYASFEALRKPLELYASRDPNNNRPTPKRVVVRGPFHRSSAVFDGAMLMDTPGAETAFENEDTDPLSGETKRAVEALGEAHVVLFCARADTLGAKNTAVFYSELMKHLSPLSIVNFLDKWEDEDEDPCLHACKAYGCAMDRTLAVSAKYAYESGLDPANRDQTLWEKSRFPVLEKAILGELRRLEPEQAIREVLESIRSTRRNNPGVRLEPNRLNAHKFISQLMSAEKIAGEMNGEPQQLIKLAEQVL